MRTHIRALKFIILVLTVILLVVLLAYTQPQKDLVPLLQETYTKLDNVDNNEDKTKEEVIVDSLKDVTVKDVKQTVMQKPNYLGEDINKKLWSLKASRAIQNGEIADGFTDLIEVVANTLSIKDQQVDYLADEGKFLSAENKIELKGNVLIKSKTLQLKTQTLDYSLDDAYAESITPVDIKAEMGHIVADSMQSFNNGDKLVLKGSVRAKLYNIKKD